jgi:hypothetical protein
VIAVIDATDLRLRGGGPACRSPIVALAVAIRCGYCWLLLSLFRPGGGLRLARWCCVSSLLFTPDWVDSAEAEKGW